MSTHLAIAQLQPEDNFFDVGASSMDVAELSVKISHELGRSVSVIDMFANASVQALVNFLYGDKTGQQSAQRLKHQEQLAQGKSRLNNRLKARKLLDEV